MIRRSRVYRAAALAIALGLTLAACGGDDDDSSTAPAGDDTASEQADGSGSATGDDTSTTPAGDATDATDSTDSTDSTDATASGEGDALTIALEADIAPTGFDPLQYANTQFVFYSAIYDSLFVTDAAGEVVPSAVSEFSTSEDGMTLTLTLRDDIGFADGSTLDAALVKSNLDRRLDEDNDIYGQFQAGQETEIASVDVVDDRTVDITWATPQPRGHTLLADIEGIIIGPAGIADITSLESAPDGSGAYELVPGETTRASTYTLAKKGDTWNADEWAYDTIVFDVITDDQARANAVISGQADVANALAANTVDLVESEAAVARAGGILAAFPVMDKDGVVNPAFAFPETRLALSYAIDRDTIVEALRPGARPTANFFPESAVGFDPEIDTRYAYDPDRARELLASVGLEDGFEFDMMVLGEPEEAQLAVQAGWQADLGVTMNFVTATSTDQLFASVTETPMIYGEDWGLGSQPAGFVAGVLVGGFMNLLGAESEAIDAALGPALGGDPDSLVALNTAVVDEGWWISVWEDFSYAGYDAGTVQEPPFAGIGGFLVTSAIEPAS